MIELNDSLKPHVERVLKGDLLNMPALHKQDVEKILYYCVGLLNWKLGNLSKEWNDMLSEFDSLKKEVEQLKTVPTWKKKR